ncbi:MAG TPA: hypothetical protein VH572_11960 [Gaiella sp.]|jgi:hypothetical protein
MTRGRNGVAAAVLVVTAAIMGAPAAQADAGQGPPVSVYTDPAPRPVAEEKAVEVVREALRQSGTPAPVSSSLLRSGAVVRPSAPPPARPKPTEARRRAPRVQLVTAASVSLTERGLTPTIRAGVASPRDQDVREPIVVVLVAAALALAGAAGAIARR